MAGHVSREQHHLLLGPSRCPHGISLVPTLQTSCITQRHAAGVFRDGTVELPGAPFRLGEHPFRDDSVQAHVACIRKFTMSEFGSY